MEVFVPLSIPLITSNILNRLSFQDWTALRLASKSSMEVTLTFWRSNAVLVMKWKKDKHSYGTKDYYEESMTRDPTHKLSPEEEIYKFHEKPFRNYRFKKDCHGLIVIPPSTEEAFKLPCDCIIHNAHFFESFASNMKYLQIQNLRSSPRKNSFLAGLKCLLLKTSLNLKELSLLYENEDGESSSCWEPEPEVDEFECYYYADEYGTVPAANNLQSLHISVHEKNHYGKIISSVRADSGLELTRNLFKCFPGLKNLSLNDEATFLIFGLKHPSFTGSHIKLKSLSLDFTNDYSLKQSEELCFDSLKDYMNLAQPPLQILNCSINATLKYIPLLGMFPSYNFQQFLYSCGNTLTRLNLTLKMCERGSYSDYINDLVGCHLPNLTHLQILLKSLEGKCSANRKFDFRSLKGIPKLKVFHSATGSESFWDIWRKSEERGLSPDKLEGYLTPKWLKAGENWPGLNLSEKERISLEEMEEFYFHLNDKLNKDSFRVLGGCWMPNIKRLAVILDEHTFPVVFEVFKKLEKVILLYLSSVPEDMITLERSRRSDVVIIEEIPDKDKSQEIFVL